MKKLTNFGQQNNLEIQKKMVLFFSENNEGNDIHEELDADKQISEQVVQTTKEEEQHFAALNNSERAELEAFRREKKVNLISGFQEDLGSEFLSEIEKNIDVHSYEELDTILSKEFTRITRSTNKKINQTHLLILGKPNKTHHKPNRNWLQSLFQSIRQEINTEVKQWVF